MSETLCEELPLHELVRPTVTPEMGFQSYEMLKGNGAYRERLKVDFVADRIVLPELDYPHLDEVELNTGIARLGRVLDQTDREPNPHTRSIIWDTVAYRTAEMYWLKSAQRLQYYARIGNAEMTDLWVARYQELCQAPIKLDTSSILERT